MYLLPDRLWTLGVERLCGWSMVCFVHMWDLFVLSEMNWIPWCTQLLFCHLFARSNNAQTWVLPFPLIDFLICPSKYCCGWNLNSYNMIVPFFLLVWSKTDVQNIVSITAWATWESWKSYIKMSSIM